MPFASQLFVETSVGRVYAQPSQTYAAIDCQWQTFEVEVEGQPLVMTKRHQANPGPNRTLKDEGDTVYQLCHRGDQALDIYWGIEWTVQYDEASYSCVPGVFYNGNNHEDSRDIVKWGNPKLEPIGICINAAAGVTAMHRNADGSTLLIAGAPQTLAGWSGWQLNRDNNTLSYCAPAIESVRMRHWRWENAPRPSYRLLPQATLTMKTSEHVSQTDSIDEMFELYFDLGRIDPTPPPHPDRLRDLDDVGKRVSDLVFELLCDHDDLGRPFFNNALIEAPTYLGLEGADVDSPMNMISGWNSGPDTALPYLEGTKEQRAWALGLVDLYADEGIAPSGLVYPRYDKSGQWDQASATNKEVFRHIRMSAAFAVFMYKAWAYEKARGKDHPNWLAAARSVTDAFMGIWEREQDFGLYVNYMADPPTLDEKGSCAGCYVLRALAIRMSVDEKTPRIEKVLSEASEHYVEKYLSRGHSNAGPLDIYRADDSESIAAFGAAWTRAYQVTQDPLYLDYAKKAAHLTSTWVLSWNAPFPPASSLEGTLPKGTVIANVKNRHLGPGICTDSGRWLAELADLTNDTRYRTMHDEIVQGALQCVSMEDGDLWGGDPKQYGPSTPFHHGQVTEQVNLTDFFHDPGEMWAVAVAWPSMAVLLALVEKDGTVGETL